MSEITNSDVIFIISHRRSGTHWTLDSIRHNFPQVSKSFLVLERLFPRHHKRMSIQQFKALLCNTEQTVMIKTHLPPLSVPLQVESELQEFINALLKQAKLIYVYRDGRDVLVSLYYYMQYFVPEVKNMSFADFIRMENDFDRVADFGCSMNRIEYWKFHVKGWLQQSNVLSLPYENLHTNYADSIQQIAQYLNMSPKSDIQRIEVSVQSRSSTGYFQDFVHKAVQKIRRPNQAPSSSVLPHHGATGDWHQHFSDEDLSLFYTIADDLLQELGYK